MSRVAMWLHVLAAVAALVFAQVSAHRVEEKQGGPSSVVLLDTDVDTIKTLAYRWDKGSTTTTLAGAKAARRALVVVDREVPPKKEKPDPKKNPHDVADAGVDVAPDALTAPPVRETGTIPGGKAVLAAATALEPLKTKRTLGAVDADKLLAMGLSPPLRFLDVTTASGKQLHLEIGEQSYGAQGRYARVVGSPEVHLIDQAVINGLEGGVDALLEKRVLLGELEQIRGLDVVVGELKASFVHVDKDQPSTRYFALKEEPTVKREAAGKLLTTLRNVRGTGLAAADVVVGAVAARFAVDVDGAPQTITVFERADGAGHLARVGDFTWTLTATAGKELIDDATAAASGE